jgi:hypothetical protein
MGNYRNHETNHYDMIHDLLEEPNLSKEAREFYEYFLKHPEETEKINKLLVNGKSIIAVSNIIADFIEEVSEVEAQSILQSIYKARTEEDFKTVFKTEDGAIHYRV